MQQLWSANLLTYPHDDVFIASKCLSPSCCDWWNMPCSYERCGRMWNAKYFLPLHHNCVFFFFFFCVHTDGRQRVWESKSDVIHEITDSRVFTENRALSVSSFYRCVTSCKKSKKSLEPFLRKMTNHLTNQLTIPAGAQLTLRTVTSWNDWLNVSHVIST